MKSINIPIELWGKDHWSTLAYIETVIVEQQYFSIKKDQRMRTHSHHKELMHIDGSDEYGTRLNNKKEIFYHDDWDCVYDAEKEKLVNIKDNKVTFTEYGYHILASLRKHKSEGGNFSNFKIK